MGMKAAYLNGQFFGRLLCLRRAENSSGGRVQWLCLCDCGGIVVASALHLKTGDAKSCGCLNRESAARRTVIRNRTHGMSHHKIYDRWKGMHERCEDERASGYKNYGGRNIVVCDGYCGDPGLERLILDMGEPPPKHDIDRKENNGGYWCGKCSQCVSNGWPFNLQWSTRSQNLRNRRNNKKIIVNGISMPVAAVPEVTGIPDGVIRGRLRLNWSGQDAATIPVGQRRPATKKG